MANHTTGWAALHHPAPVRDCRHEAGSGRALDALEMAVKDRCACCVADAVDAALAAGATRDQVLDAMGGGIQASPEASGCRCARHGKVAS